MNNDRITELEKQLDYIKSEIEQLKAEKSQIKPWRAEHGENYYHISQIGNISVGVEIFHNVDDNIFNCGNYYRTRELAEQDAKELALRGRVRQLRDTLCEGYQFVSGENNFYVYFDVVEKYYFVSIGGFHCVVGTVYFDTKEHAQQACDILNKELENGNLEI